jgi:two-component system alkaline phosphatase synthesis response regulator PhoP
VLVVDDHPPVVIIIRKVLEGGGFRVLSARTGDECLAAVHAEQPDLLILDLVMPGMDGLEVLRTLRQDPATRHLPVIVLTAWRGDGEGPNGWLGVADRYLTKPFRTAELVAAVEEVLAAPARR